MKNVELIKEDDSYTYYKIELLGMPVIIKQHKETNEIILDVDSIAKYHGFENMNEMRGSDAFLDAMNYYKAINGEWPNWSFVEKNN